MSGCRNAIAERDRMRAVAESLALEGEQVFGRRLGICVLYQCGDVNSKPKTTEVVDSAAAARLPGGTAICGTCAGDVGKSDAVAAECEEGAGSSQSSQNPIEAIQRPPLVSSGSS